MSSNAAGGELDNGWERALELAWDSFLRAHYPVGAVVLNSSDVIVAEGRGRRYEKTGPPRQLASTHVAHTELNALAQLGADRHYQDHVLLTTLEPCGMCHGAAVQATVGSCGGPPVPTCWPPSRRRCPRRSTWPDAREHCGCSPTPRRAEPALRDCAPPCAARSRSSSQINLPNEPGACPQNPFLRLQAGRNLAAARYGSYSG